MAPPGIKPASPCSPALRSNHSATLAVNDVLLMFYITFYTTINYHVWQCMYEIDFG